MSKRFFRLGLMVMALSSWAVHGYEIETHGEITFEAYQWSVLTDPLLPLDLGIESATDAFREAYFDVSGGTDDLAQYVILREENGQLMGYQICLLRASGGVWRIGAM